MTGRFKRALLEKGDMSGMSQKSGHMRATKKGAGMTPEGVKEYRRRNKGSKLKTAVTTPPSKLKPGSKAAKRRKSFCARSRGWTGERGKAARRRWNCSTDVNPNALQQIAEWVAQRLMEYTDEEQGVIDFQRKVKAQPQKFKARRRSTAARNNPYLTGF